MMLYGLADLPIKHVLNLGVSWTSSIPRKTGNCDQRRLVGWLVVDLVQTRVGIQLGK